MRTPNLSSVWLLGMLLACSGTSSTDTPSEPSRLILGPPEITLSFEGSVSLEPRTTTPNGAPIALPGVVTFASRNPIIASVDATGRVSGTGPGQTHIVGAILAAGRTLVDSVQVSVICTPGQSIAVAPAQQSLTIGERFTPSYRLTVCAADQAITPDLTWSSSDTSVLLVDPGTGEGTGRAVGVAYLVARDAIHGALTTGVTVTVR